MPPTDGATRATPVWMLAIAALLLAARVGSGVWEAANPESRPELVEWTAPSAAEETARASGRLVLYAFTDRRNAASRRLASDLFADPKRATELGRAFVPIRVEGDPAEDSPEIAALRERFKVTTLPALVVATPDGARSKLIRGDARAATVLEQLVVARIELLDLPIPNRRGFQFQFGGRHGGGSDSSDAGGDTLRVIE